MSFATGETRYRRPHARHCAAATGSRHLIPTTTHSVFLQCSPTGDAADASANNSDIWRPGSWVPVRLSRSCSWATSEGRKGAGPRARHSQAACGPPRPEHSPVVAKQGQAPSRSIIVSSQKWNCSTLAAHCFLLIHFLAMDRAAFGACPRDRLGIRRWRLAFGAQD